MGPIRTFFSLGNSGVQASPGQQLLLCIIIRIFTQFVNHFFRFAARIQMSGLRIGQMVLRTSSGNLCLCSSSFITLGSQQNLLFNAKLHIQCQHGCKPKIKSNDALLHIKVKADVFYYLYFNRADYSYGSLSAWYLNNQYVSFDIWSFPPEIHYQLYMLIYDRL